MGRSNGPLAVARRREKDAIRLAAYRAKMADLRASGARCGVCRHRGESSMWSCALNAPVVEMLCTLHGEGNGVRSPTTPNNLCDDFSSEITATAPAPRRPGGTEA